MSISVFDILRRPVVTEKSNYLASKLGQYVFEVKSDVTREQVKTAVGTAFDVDVVRVISSICPPRRTATPATADWLCVTAVIKRRS